MYQRVLQTIRAAMPPNSELIEHVENRQSWRFDISWPLNNDQARPNKRSKTIRILIDHAVVADLHGVPLDHIVHRLSQYLTARLDHFDPDHPALRNEIPPIEEWIIQFEDLA